MEFFQRTNLNVHVIIPTIEGREEILLQCLVSLLGQNYKQWDLTICTTNKNLKIGDRDDLIVVNRFLGTLVQLGIRVRVIFDEKQQGPGTAVQTLLDSVPGTYAFRVDDDVILTPQVLEKLMETMSLGDDVAAVGCPVNAFGVPFVNYKDYWEKNDPQLYLPFNGYRFEPHLQGNGSYEKMNDNFQYHSCLGDFEIAEVDFLSGYALLLNTRYVNVVGGYHDKDGPKWHTEDWWATLKLRQAGYRLLIRGDAIAFHHHYSYDFSHKFANSHAEEDKSIFHKYRNSIHLNKDRKVGRVTGVIG